MKQKEIIERSKKSIKPYCVTDGKKFRLKDIDPGDTGNVTSEDKPLAKELLEQGVQVLAELQDVLYGRINGQSCSSFRPWTLREKMARSNMSCPALILRGAKSFHSRAHRRKISNMTFSGVA